MSAKIVIPQKPSAIIFDWDNTLVDAWAILHGAMNCTLEHMGQASWSLDEAKVNIQKSLKDSFPELFQERWEEAKDVFYASYEALHKDYVKPLPYVEMALERFSEMKLPLAVFSNKRGDLLRAEVAALGWEQFFQGVYGAGDFPEDKPSPIGVQHILAELKQDMSQQSQAFFVGDSPIDVECALNSSLYPIFIEGSAEEEGRFFSGQHYFRVFDKKNVVSFENCLVFYDFVNNLADK